MSIGHDLVERIKGWERIRGKEIPDVIRIKDTFEPDLNDEHGGKDYFYGDGTYFFKDSKYEYKVDKRVFAPDQGTRIARRWTYRRAL
jgi:hypothetical protein